MNRPLRKFGRIALLAFLCSSFSRAVENEKAVFYKEEPLFSTSPLIEKSSQAIERFGPVGLSIELVQPVFVMKVGGVEEGSPAAATGKFAVGQIIERINGQGLTGIDPRIQLGNILTAAEASDGLITFMLKEPVSGELSEVPVRIPVLGAYSPTWPLHCQKSDRIVRNFAEYLAKDGSNKGFGNIGMLFLLGTGEDRDLPPVKAWVHSLQDKNPPIASWYLGYGGIPLCEYYLRTGDPVALPIIQKWADTAVAHEFLGGWSQRGPAGNVTYGGGGGLHHAASTPAATFLILAKECGASIPDRTLHAVLTQFFRLAGRGNNPYGDNKPELGFVDNGKNSTLAFTMAAAASLSPQGEQSVYAGARDVAALTAFYTSTYMLHGHTGGGIGELWRSAAMGLLHAKRPQLYREFMDQRRWSYELSRRFDGSFGIVGGTDRYDNVSWGAGYALTYIIPRKTLRITGAPPSPFAKTCTLPERAWGVAEDDAFNSIESAIQPDGTRPDFSRDTFARDAAKGLLTWIAKPETDDATLLRYAHHPDSMIRLAATRAMLGMETHYLGKASGAGSPRTVLIKPLLYSQDARVRRAAIHAISDRFSGEELFLFLGSNDFEHLMTKLADPGESWWVKDSILMLVSSLPADPVAPHLDLILKYLNHKAPWLQHASLSALASVIDDERCYRKAVPAIGEMLKHCQRWSASVPVRYGPLAENLAAARSEVKMLAAECLKDAFAGYTGSKTAAGGLDITKIYHSHMEAIAKQLASMPGGHDVLYEISRKKFPQDKLPYEKIFLDADPEQFGPELRKTIVPVIREHLIYEFMATNRDKLLDAAAGKVQNNYVSGASALDGLVSLYQKIGIDDYAWQTFGPDLKNAVWDYHMFDPDEALAHDLSPWRYRKVSLPKGMESWFRPDFDPTAAGWRKGQAPFGQYMGKLITDMSEMAGLKCRIDEPMRTLWDKEVLLMRGRFDFPALKPGHIYRFRIGENTQVGCGDGYRIYINGNQVIEQKIGIGRREGGRERGAYITKDHVDAFGTGPVTIAATTFLRYGDKAVVSMPPVPQGVFSLWIEEAKLPPLDAATFQKTASVVSMLSSDWQARQDPDDAEIDQEEGRFHYDGRFVADADLLGSWQTVAVVTAPEAFDPTVKQDSRKLPFKDITFNADGTTQSPDLIWSGRVLIDLKRYQALRITPRLIDGSNFLFIETGGFSAKHPLGWKSSLAVLKRINL